MPIRKTPLITGNYYHIFNRGINHQTTFLKKKNGRDYERARQTLLYYQSANSHLRFSYFLAKSKSQQTIILSQLAKSPQRITIIAYCLMPNHFHLLLQQNVENGISRYLADFQNSYTKYFDLKHNRSGAIFNRQFKAVQVNSEEQLLHLTRYIHLNPYSANLILKDQIIKYPYSSLQEYLSNNHQLTNPQSLLNISPSEYKSFVLDQADHQKNLEQLKHLALDF